VTPGFPWNDPFMLSRPAFRLTAAVLISGTLSTSCTASPDKADTPASASAARPSMPPPAQKNDEQGATTFASYWLEMIDYGYRTLDTTPLLGLAAPSCRACSEFVAQLERDKAAGFHYEGGRIHFRSAQPTGTRPEKSTVTVLFDQDELKVLDRENKTMETVPANRTIFVFDLSWSGGGWRASTIKLGMENGAPPK
jgi:hypothetical protein